MNQWLERRTPLSPDGVEEICQSEHRNSGGMLLTMNKKSVSVFFWGYEYLPRDNECRMRFEDVTNSSAHRNGINRFTFFSEPIHSHLDRHSVVIVIPSTFTSNQFAVSRLYTLPSVGEAHTIRIIEYGNQLFEDIPFAILRRH
ncbi:hypothetical protein TNIN_188921 [Trichonephila inaurata madagascariensis]|uniref:Uncharacterized protein n=1 Tax=Trichonephila inaurata madagascariensis TaxID=2747483 RepID=A0A8X6YXU5_9ARAC|nr:hypothetical protein TNIN_188921 [Trichonephila inaurata madagascariensis]